MAKLKADQKALLEKVEAMRARKPAAPKPMLGVGEIGLLLAAGVAISVLLTYCFALIGEPTDYWLWHTILRVI